MSTRREGRYRFDHGAQYFTARDPRFRRHVHAWRERGLVREWDARLGVIDANGVGPTGSSMTRYIAVPGMNAICRELADELPDCRFEWRVARARLDGHQWRLERDDGSAHGADLLVVTAPPAQARALLDLADVSGRIAEVEMLPCWAVMVAFDRPLQAGFDAAFVNGGPLAWISSQNTRPERPADDAWVLHATPDWSQAHLEEAPDQVIDLLVDAARKLPGARSAEVAFATAHRWRYSLAKSPLQVGALWFADHRLAVAGDWCNGSRVEGAFLSGVAAAGRVMGSAYARSK